MKSVRPLSSVSRKSVRSAFLSQKSFWINNDKFSQQLLDYFKLLALVLPPIGIVVTLCGISLAAGRAAINTQYNLQSNLIASQKIGLIATLMAQERGTTCLYLSTTDYNDSLVVFDKLKGIRMNVDYAIGNTTKWLGTASDGEGFESREAFSQMLNDFRNSTTFNVTKCTTDNGALWWYTAKINKIIEQMNREFQKSLEGQFWASVGSYHDILMAKDLIGIRRALGSSFFARGYFPLSDYATFSRISGAAEYLLNSSLAMTPSAKQQYDALYTQQISVVHSLNEFSKTISTNDPNNRPDALMGIKWFDNMTAYIKDIDLVQSAIGVRLVQHVNDVLGQNLESFYVTTAIIVIILIVCPITTVWYAVQSKKMLKKIKNFTDELTSKTKELDQERKKTDLLLHQLLPKSVIADLKINKQVMPEMFDSVTIYFSDIQGFTTLSGRSTPFEVIELLNSLYTKFDGVLDQYDVYKVETIGDAYMVASGLPKKNGGRHSNEVCTMALHLLWTLESMRVPRSPNERLLLRIGLHTGSCAAGVVGLKMPRYCLFGDTVNTASRMESNGQALRVHLSPSVYEHLLDNHPNEFDFIPREKINVKGKGLMQTYWLLGKKDFPFRVNLEETVRVAEATSYWRLDNADEGAQKITTQCTSIKLTSTTTQIKSTKSKIPLKILYKSHTNTVPSLRGRFVFKTKINKKN